MSQVLPAIRSSCTRTALGVKHQNPPVLRTALPCTTAVRFEFDTALGASQNQPTPGASEMAMMNDKWYENAASLYTWYMTLEYHVTFEATKGLRLRS